MGITVLPVTLGTFTVKVKLYIVQHLVSNFIHGVNYLFALRATLDFYHEVIRLCHPTSGLSSIIGFTNRDRDRRQVVSVVLWQLFRSGHTNSFKYRCACPLIGSAAQVSYHRLARSLWALPA
jgi:hypothetical protein